MEGVGGGVTNEGAGCNFKGGEVDINGVENVEEYRPGGYHPVAPGDVLGGRLVILQIKHHDFILFFLRPLWHKSISNFILEAQHVSASRPGHMP